MKFYVLLGCLVVLAMVSHVRSDEAYQKFINAIPAEVQTKCLAEADLVADKDKLLANEESVDAAKLSCFTACALKQSGVLTDGKISYDVLEKQLDVIYADDPKLAAKKEVVKECIGKVTGSTDCEKVKSMTDCILKEFDAKGLH